MSPKASEETALTTTRVNAIMRDDTSRSAVERRSTRSSRRFRKRGATSCTSSTPDRQLDGMIRLHDIKNHLRERRARAGHHRRRCLRQSSEHPPDATLADILSMFDDVEAHELPVVEPSGRTSPGTVNRRDLITALSVEVLQTRNLRAKYVEHQGAEHYVEIPPGHEIRRIDVPEDMVGRSLADIDLRRRTGVTVLTILQTRNGREDAHAAPPPARSCCVPTISSCSAPWRSSTR